MDLKETLIAKVYRTEGKILNLGCGNQRIENAFGVDYYKTKACNLQWDVEKTLEKMFWGRFDLVYSSCLLDHLGNPLNFLLDCRRYAKPGGFIQVIVDNADYWRYHRERRPFGNYHAGLWFKEKQDIKVQHKMMFQMGHLNNLFKLAGIEVVRQEYFWKASVDRLLPERIGSAYISIVGKNKA